MIVQASAAQTTIGQPNAVAMVFFFVFITITLGITYWAARKPPSSALPAWFRLQDSMA
jgi:hypothetical protein